MATIAAFTSHLDAAFSGRDLSASREQAETQSRLESVAYVHAQVALAAKLAAVDGTVNKAELAAYQEILPATAEFDTLRLRSLFMKHIADHASALQYARQIGAMLRTQPDAKIALLQKLFTLATSDAALNAAEMELLRAVADIFGLSRAQFKVIVNQHCVPQQSPYAVLGVTPEATAEETRARYLTLVQKLHPDRYQSAGASDDTMAMLSDQLAALNAAYADIKRGQPKKSAATGALSRWWSVRNTKGAKTANG